MICQIIQIPIEKGVIADGGVPAYIHNSLEFKNRPDLFTNCGDIESLALEMMTEKTCNTVLHSLLHGPPNGHFGHFGNFLKIS